MVPTKGVPSDMRMTTADIKELQSRGARVLSPADKHTEEVAYKEILREYIRNMVSLEETIKVVEDTITAEVSEQLKRLTSHKAKIEFDVERDSNGLLKKVTARER